MASFPPASALSAQPKVQASSSYATLSTIGLPGQSMSASKVKQGIGEGLSAQHNSPQRTLQVPAEAPSSPNGTSSISLQLRSGDNLLAAVKNIQQNTPLKQGQEFSTSQVSVRANPMFSKHQAPTASQQSRQAAHYQSMSPMVKHRIHQLSNSAVKSSTKFNDQMPHTSKAKADASKYGSAFSKQLTAATRQDPRNTKMKEVKARAGSQYVNAKKLHSSHQSTSLVRGRNNFVQSTSHEQDPADHTQAAKPSLVAVETSFMRLHKGESSVVRGPERRQLLQHSSSLARKQQRQEGRFQSQSAMKTVSSSGYSRLPGSAFTAAAIRLSQAPQTDRGQEHIYQSPSGHLSAMRASNSDQRLDSDRKHAADDAANARNGCNRSKGQKQPRQSKSTTGQTLVQQVASSNARTGQQETAAARAQTVLNQMQDSEAAEEQPAAQQQLPQVSSASQLARATQRLTASQLVASVPMQRAPGAPEPQTTYKAQTGSGLETSLNFTRRLIEETAARKQRNEKSVTKESDISQVSLMIKSNLASDQQVSSQSRTHLKLEVSNSVKQVGSGGPQKFISPKFSKPQLSNIQINNKVGVTQIISPIGTHGKSGSAASIEKRLNTSLQRGPQHASSSLAKPSQPAAAAKQGAPPQTAFSPDKRPNMSRSQIQQLGGAPSLTKRAMAKEKPTTREGQQRFQRMFGGAHNNAHAMTQHSVSPAKGMSQPGYLKGTLSQKNRKASNQGTSQGYQLNRVRPTKQQTLISSYSHSQHFVSNQQSQKELAAVPSYAQQTSRNGASHVRQSQSKAAGGPASKRKQGSLNPQWQSFYPQPKTSATNKGKGQQRAYRPSSKNQGGDPGKAGQSKYSSKSTSSASKFPPVQGRAAGKVTVLDAEVPEEGKTGEEAAEVYNKIDLVDVKPVISSHSHVEVKSLNQLDLQEVKQGLERQSTSKDVDDEKAYKNKQENIIEMIQSNMRKCDDIQQSLSSGRFLSSAKKVSESRQSSKSLSGHPDQQLVARTESITYETMKVTTEAAEPEKGSIASPKVAKAPQTLTDQNDRSLQKQQTEGVRSPPKTEPRLAEEPMATAERVMSPTQTVSQHKVEAKEVADGEMEADVSPRESKDLYDEPLPPVAQEESLNLPGAEGTSSEPYDSQAFNSVQRLDQSELQASSSVFAIALANKKQESEQKSLQVNVRGSSESASHVQPQEQGVSSDDESESVGDDGDAPAMLLKPEELEVVNEEAGEDRNSIASQALKNKIIAQTDSLPMDKEHFLERYRGVLTEQEQKELNELELSQGRVFYAADITKRKSAAEAKTNSDDNDGYYIVEQGDQILYRFEIQRVLGKGSFAQVVCCFDHVTGRRMAVKINRNTEIDHKFAQQEGKLLKFLMQQDPEDEYNIVRMKEHIRFRDHQCFVFELLNTDLFEHLKEGDFAGFSEGQIQVYAAQLLKALVFLEDRSVIHCDLKPENILCVDQGRQKLKVVDFGSGCLVHEQVYTYVQSRYYRAPEVILRIPYSEKVDIWSFGCILAELYTGEPLFPGNSEQEQLEFIMELCGIFPHTMVDKSRKKDYYFDYDYSPFLIEDPREGILRIPENRTFEEAIPSRDQLFIDFVRSCLVLDPEERPGAKCMTQHPWISAFFGREAGVALGAFHGAEQRESNIVTEENQEHQYDVEASEYVPVRSRPGPNFVEARVSTDQFDQFDLSNNMLRQFDVNQAEYCDGRVTGELFKSEADLSSKYDGGGPRYSRGRDEDGARASAAEVSPNKPQSSFLTEQQRMTSFIQKQSQPLLSAETSPMRMQNPGQKLQKSPLKPSNESQVEHSKYSGSKGTSQSFTMAAPPAELVTLLSKNMGGPSATAAKNASVIEEPKIISKTSSFASQQPQ